ncbi:hypothetical protein SBRY_50090 [Actinacidiphila bryophytorum]|uniref:Uncharacterized protein n=1 Tax=Actinacidiphila bryophytorum TaxID=1436133 RepID=A0A9W4H448_9ACTN|nr:hypothetical protein SBRY_50090 [Actinacidiphila bryophytorum]
MYQPTFRSTRAAPSRSPCAERPTLTGLPIDARRDRAAEPARRLVLSGACIRCERELDPADHHRLMRDQLLSRTGRLGLLCVVRSVIEELNKVTPAARERSGVRHKER